MLQSGELSELVEETVPWWKVERESVCVLWSHLYVCYETVALSMDKKFDPAGFKHELPQDAACYNWVIFHWFNYNVMANHDHTWTCVHVCFSSLMFTESSQSTVYW